MRVCLICEGSYPYVPGDVSIWVQMLCSHFSDMEFVIWSIATTKKEMGTPAYKMPENIKAVQTMYIGEQTFQRTGKKVRLSKKEKECLRGLMIGSVDEIGWTDVLHLAKKHRKHMCDILMSEPFFDICLEEYLRLKSHKNFLHFLWNFRGIYFPIMSILAQDIPKADIYHSVSAGYAGILGSCASFVEGKPFMLSEHGIYTRSGRKTSSAPLGWLGNLRKSGSVFSKSSLSSPIIRQAWLQRSLRQTASCRRNYSARQKRSP